MIPVRLQHFFLVNNRSIDQLLSSKTRPNFIDSFKDKGDLEIIEFMLQQHILENNTCWSKWLNFSSNHISQIQQKKIDTPDRKSFIYTLEINFG